MNEWKLIPAVEREVRVRKNARTNSIALIASNNGKGCILAYHGSGIEADIEAIGIGTLEDHGLDNAPDGLSIWEGKLTGRSWSSPETGFDVETSLDGEFRDLTGEEWQRLQDMHTPWEFEELPPSSDSQGDKR